MLLTIFTPAYNRSDTLERTFRSLCRQAFTDFEWLIVDDGSTDGTEAMVASFAAHSPFAIRYFRQAHGGKHRAYNTALPLARGEFFFTVDSDDYLSDGSLAIVAANAPILRNDGALCGIVALKEKTSGGIYGRHFRADAEVVTLARLERARCNGERSFVFKTEIARAYPFPEVEGEDFVTESVVYDRIDRDWAFLALDKPLTVCEYRPDGLSNNIYRLMWNNPVGFMIYHSQRIDGSDSLWRAVHSGLRYQAFRRIAKTPTLWNRYAGRHAWLVRLLTPVGTAGRWYYKAKCRWH